MPMRYGRDIEIVSGDFQRFLYDNIWFQSPHRRSFDDTGLSSNSALIMTLLVGLV